jgi:hypothetical protein
MPLYVIAQVDLKHGGPRSSSAAMERLVARSRPRSDPRTTLSQSSPSRWRP